MASSCDVGLILHERPPVLAEISLPGNQSIRLTPCTLAGRPAIDLRLCTSWRALGEIGPTSVGIRVPLEAMPALIEALQKELA